MELAMKLRHLTGIILCSALWLVGVACTQPEPRSAIVDKIERAGAGDLSGTPAPQIEDWLRKHEDLAMQVDDMCKPVRGRADANWPASTEGRVCTAAQNASMFYLQRQKPLKSDGKKFGPGWH
jgi:hypothetical protein